MSSATSGDWDLTSAEADPDDRCISCGAEVDHYLGCPDDPSPDYQAEAEMRRDWDTREGK